MASGEEATGTTVEKGSGVTMEDTFVHQGKQYTLSVKADGLQWTPLSKGKPE